MGLRVMRVCILGFEWYQVSDGEKVLHQFPNEVYAFRRKEELEQKRMKEMKLSKSDSSKLPYYWLKN